MPLIGPAVFFSSSPVAQTQTARTQTAQTQAAPTQAAEALSGGMATQPDPITQPGPIALYRYFL